MTEPAAAPDETDPLEPLPPPRSATITQVTRLAGKDVAMLRENAATLGASETEAVRRAIRHSHWLLTLQEKNRTLLVRDDSTGEVREVILLP